MEAYDYYEYKTEIIDGKEVMLASPTAKHNYIIGDLFSIVKRKIGNECSVFCDSMDLVIDEANTYIPDLTVCKKSDITDGARITGTPKFILEVWSKGNKETERTKKIAQYEQKGIKQFLEIDYVENWFKFHNLIEGKFELQNSGTLTKPHYIQLDFLDFELDVYDLVHNCGEETKRYLDAEVALNGMKMFIDTWSDEEVNEKTGIPLQIIQKVRGTQNGSI
ncbi:MAG: hypothetical protein ATN35_05415 [Epulopiscium sp. Nele67-Bin004]|nr:MAG: hypothetical protein ATN35_05415 [Epulopiscium sp. Nele67-Bin004]